MASVDGITVARAQDIENASVVSGRVDAGDGHLYLSTYGGFEFSAGVVIDDTHLDAHAADVTTHGVTSGEIVGTDKTQALSNKLYQDPVLQGAVVINSGSTLRASSMSPVTVKNSTGITKNNATFSEGTCNIQVVAPPSGVIEVKGYARVSTNGSNKTGWFGFAVYQGADLSGTQIVAPSNTKAGLATSAVADAVQTCSFCELVTGLTPGTTYTVTTMVKTDIAGGTISSYGLQTLVVAPQM